MTERQASRLRKARRKLAACQDLLKDEHLEDAVSRAYYVMFYIAEAFLDGEGLSFSSHSAVIAGFGKVFAKTGQVPSEFHRFLKEAEEARLGRDYDEDYNVSLAEAEKHIQRAEQFLKLAEEAIGRP